jgi:hypothetical protein
MAEEKLTLGNAIDLVVSALLPFEEKDRASIVNMVCAHLDIKSLSVGSNQPSPVGFARPTQITHSTTEIDIPIVTHGIDIRQLKEQKKPTTAAQMACLVAYYLQELAPTEERKATVTVLDMETYFKQAKYRLPKVDQLLIDSKRAGYFESPSRGEYRLTRVGYNLVTHSMPSKNQA